MPQCYLHIYMLYITGLIHLLYSKSTITQLVRLTTHNIFLEINKEMTPCMAQPASCMYI